MMTSQVVRTLEKKGLLERLPHPTDGRAFLLAPTTRGEVLIDDANRSVEQADEAFFAPLGIVDVDRLAGLLATLNHAHQRQSRPGAE